MRKRIGTKIYDTDKAILIETRDDGIQVYRKKNSPQFFVYNPNGKNKHEMFFEIPPEDTDEYTEKDGELSTKVREGTTKVQFSAYDSARIKHLAAKAGMSMSKFLLMPVDEYERKEKL